MRILLSNDDGIHAEGIKALYQELSQHHEVIVVAPDRNQSASSSSLTINRPLKITKVNEHSYCVDGTPADCTHVALNSFLKGKIDLVVSGINNGDNLGDAVLYSGTVAAALEGRYLKIPSIAVSLVGNKHYATAAKIVSEILNHIEDVTFVNSNILNINVPDIPLEDIKGYEVTSLGRRYSGGDIVETFDPNNNKLYWIGQVAIGALEKNTDFLAVHNHYVSITPISIDMTDKEDISSLATSLRDLLI